MILLVVDQLIKFKCNMWLNFVGFMKWRLCIIKNYIKTIFWKQF
jgi:hypothetical protein